MAHGCGYEDTMNKQQVSPLKATKSQFSVTVPFKATDPRKKGKKYKTGANIDETDLEEGKFKSTNLGDYNNDYNVENVSNIQEDKKGQYMTTLDDSTAEHTEDKFGKGFVGNSSKTVSNYNQGRDAVRDTLRPKRGKHFKQGWGEDDRNPTGKNWMKKNKKS